MKKLVLFWFILINPIILSAHYPLSSKYYLEAKDGISFLNIYLSQAGVNKAMIEHYGLEEINDMSTAEYKEVIVSYVRDHIELKVDGENLNLLEGGIKLGDHQTDLKFIISNMPTGANKVEVSVPAFIKNGDHQNIFSYNIFGATDKVILSKKNDFKSTILFGEQQSTTGSIWLIGILIWAVLLSLYVWWKKESAKKSDLVLR